MIYVDNIISYYILYIYIIYIDHHFFSSSTGNLFHHLGGRALMLLQRRHPGYPQPPLTRHWASTLGDGWCVKVPSGKYTRNYGKAPCFMGKQRVTSHSYETVFVDGEIPDDHWQIPSPWRTLPSMGHINVQHIFFKHFGVIIPVGEKNWKPANMMMLKHRSWSRSGTGLNSQNHIRYWPNHQPSHSCDYLNRINMTNHPHKVGPPR